MKAYFDTNVLVSAAVMSHPHHAPAFALFSAAVRGSVQGCTSNHALLEVYAVLTRAPFQPRIQPMEAIRFLDETILPHFEVAGATTSDYKTLLRRCASTGRGGAVVYDALHIQCAKRSACDRIYTFNVDHFRALADDEWKDRITSP